MSFPETGLYIRDAVLAEDPTIHDDHKGSFKLKMKVWDDSCYYMVNVNNQHLVAKMIRCKKGDVISVGGSLFVTCWTNDRNKACYRKTITVSTVMVSGTLFVAEEKTEVEKMQVVAYVYTLFNTGRVNTKRTFEEMKTVVNSLGDQHFFSKIERKRMMEEEEEISKKKHCLENVINTSDVQKFLFGDEDVSSL